MRSTTAILLALACIAAAGGGGCVTEIVPVAPSGPTGRNSGGVPVSPTASGSAGAAAGSVSSTRVAASVRPLGSIRYDGLTLPLVTPDGRWIVTQTGSVPPVESVLAEPGAVSVPGNAIKAYEIIEGQLKPVEWETPAGAGEGGRDGGGGAAGGLSFESHLSPTAGLLLGRCAGEGWVLVERPNEDGSRWIGKLSLLSGQVEWLVQGTSVNAQALLLRDGTLVFTRRDQAQATTELVMRKPGAAAATQAPTRKTMLEIAPDPGAPAAFDPAQERVVRRDGWKFCQPIATPDQSTIAVIAIGPQDAQLLAFSAMQVDATPFTAVGSGATAVASPTPTLVARELMGPMGAAAAFQAVTSVEACPPPIDSPLRNAFLLINADRKRLGLWDPTQGTMSLLPASVATGVRVHSAVASGLVMAAPRGMDFWTGSGLPARLLAGSYIPRSFTAADGSRLICLSPQQGTSVPTLNVTAVQLVAPTP